MPLSEDTQKLVIDMLQELNESNSPRVRTLLLTNLIEAAIKDCIEKLTGSKSAREIPRNTIVKILAEKNVITSEGASDITQIFSIRDIYAHRISLIEANAKAETILSNMKVVQKNRTAEWDQKDIARKIFDTADWFAFWLTQAYNDMK